MSIDRAEQARIDQQRAEAARGASAPPEYQRQAARFVANENLPIPLKRYAVAVAFWEESSAALMNERLDGEYVKYDDVVEHIDSLQRRIDRLVAPEGVGLTRRYDIVPHIDGSDRMERTPTGEWVRHDDALAAKDAEIAATVQEVREWIGIAQRWTHRATEAEAQVATLKEACEIIAGKRQCLDNLMSNRDVAEEALRLVALSTLPAPAASGEG